MVGELRDNFKVFNFAIICTMPIENYIDRETGTIVEHFTKGALPPFIEIDGVVYERDFGSGNLNFKLVGPGFYANDYKNK